MACPIARLGFGRIVASEIDAPNLGGSRVESLVSRARWVIGSLSQCGGVPKETRPSRGGVQVVRVCPGLSPAGRGLLPVPSGVAPGPTVFVTEPSPLCVRGPTELEAAPIAVSQTAPLMPLGAATDAAEHKPRCAAA